MTALCFVKPSAWFLLFSNNTTAHQAGPHRESIHVVPVRPRRMRPQARRRIICTIAMRPTSVSDADSVRVATRSRDSQ